jgi:hypothetical protein
VREIPNANLGTRVEFPVSPLPFLFFFFLGLVRTKTTQGAPMRASGKTVVEFNDGTVGILQHNS